MILKSLPKFKKKRKKEKEKEKYTAINHPIVANKG